MDQFSREDRLELKVVRLLTEIEQLNKTLYMWTIADSFDEDLTRTTDRSYLVPKMMVNILRKYLFVNSKPKHHVHIYVEDLRSLNCLKFV